MSSGALPPAWMAMFQNPSGQTCSQTSIGSSTEEASAPGSIETAEKLAHFV
jgi:hypothetical protein